MSESYSSVPLDLKSLPRWVTWKLEKVKNNDGKTRETKVPYQLSGRKAESDDPVTWATFNEVKHCVPRKTDGAGFVFNGDGIIGIDLDHCFDKNGNIDPLFREIVENLRSYSEISPSGTGLHIFIKCKERPYEKGRRKKLSDGTDRGLEIYSEKRFFTVTGTPYNGSGNKIIEYPAETIRSLCNAILDTDQPSKPSGPKTDEEIIEIMKKSKNGFKIGLLLDGKWQNIQDKDRRCIYPSPSEADGDLSMHLAYYTGKNAGQMKRIMLSSKMYRPDWFPSKLDTTIATAIEKCEDVYISPKKSKSKRQSVNEEIPEYQEQERPWFDREGTLYLECVEYGDIPRYSYARMNEGKIEFIDDLIVEEPLTENDKILLSGKKYIPRKLIEDKNGQIIRIVGIPIRSLMEKTPAEPMTAILPRIKAHVHRYCDLKDSDEDICIFYIVASWYYPKLSTIPYLRLRSDTGKGKSRILKVISDLCFYPVKAGGASTASGIMRFSEYWHGSLVVDEMDLKGSSSDGGYANDTIKFLNLGFERGQFFIKTDRQDPGKQDVFDPFCPKIIAMRGVFQDPATEGRCLSISPFETERTDIDFILPAEYEPATEELRAALAKFTLTHWDLVKESDPYPNFRDVECEPRLKQLGSPLAKVLSAIKPDGLEEFKHYVEQRGREIKKDRAMSPLGTIVNECYDEAMNPNNTLGSVTIGHIAESLNMSGQSISKNLKDAGFVIENVRLKVPDINNPAIMRYKSCKIAGVPDARAWREIVRRYILISEPGINTDPSSCDIECPEEIRSRLFVDN
jgi:hypothetical protein